MAQILRRASAAMLLISLWLGPAAAPAASSDTALRDKLFAAYAKVTSYRLAVLGSVRSNGYFQAPDRYAMTTDFENKPIKTIFVGSSFWIFNDGRWEKSSNPTNNLYVDISGLLRNARDNKNAPFVRLPNTTRNGKTVAQFEYTFKNGTEETCDYDARTYLVSRCKAEDLTILYSDYNKPVPPIKAPA